MMQSVENFDHIYEEPINDTTSQYYPFELQEEAGKYHLNADLYSFKHNKEVYEYANKQHEELYRYQNNGIGYQLMQHIEEPENDRVNLYDVRDHYPMKHDEELDNYNSSNTHNSNFNQQRNDGKSYHGDVKPINNFHSTYGQRVHNERFYQSQQQCWGPQTGHEFNSQPQLPSSRGSRFHRGGRGRGGPSFDHRQGYFPNKRFRGRRNRNSVDVTILQPFNDPLINQNQHFESDFRFNNDSASGFPCKCNNATEKRHKCDCKNIENTLGTILHGERVNNHHDFHVDTSPIVQNQNRPKKSRWDPSLNSNGEFSNEEHQPYSRPDRRFIPSRSRKRKPWARFGINNSFRPGFVPKNFKRDHEKQFRKKRESQQSISPRMRKPCLPSRRRGSSVSEADGITEKEVDQKQREYYHDAKLKVEAWFETCLFDEIPTEDEFEDSQLQGQENQYLLMEESCDVKIAMSDISKDIFYINEQSSINGNGGKTPGSLSSSVSRGSVSGGNLLMDLESDSSSTTIPYPPERYTVTRLRGDFGCDPYFWLDYKNLLLPLRANLIFKQVTRMERVFLPLPFQHLPDLNEVTLFSYSVTRLCYTVPQILTLNMRGNFGVACMKSVAKVKVVKKRRKYGGSGRKSKKVTKSPKSTVKNNEKSDHQHCHVASIDISSSIMVVASTSINLKHPKKRYQEWKETETDRKFGDYGSNPRSISKLEICKTTCPKKRFLAEERSFNENMKGEIKKSFERERKTVRSSPSKPEIDSVYISEPNPITVFGTQTTVIFNEPIKPPIGKVKPPPEPASSPPEPASSPPEPASSPPEPASSPPEPAPSPPEPAPSPPEPAPSPPEPAPSPPEPAPSPPEPAPSPPEPAPSPPEPAPSPPETAPSPPEPAPSPTEPTKLPNDPSNITKSPIKVTTETPAEPTRSTKSSYTLTEQFAKNISPKPTETSTVPTMVYDNNLTTKRRTLLRTPSPTTQSQPEPAPSPTEPTKFPNDPSNTSKSPIKVTNETPAEPTRLTKSSYTLTEQFVKKSSPKPTETSTVPTMVYDNNLPTKRRTLLRTPSPTSYHPRHQTNYNYNNKNQTSYATKSTSFSEQAHSFMPSGYNKVHSYRDDSFINNYPRTLGDDNLVPPGVSQNSRDVFNFSINHSSCNSGVYAPDPPTTSRMSYSETLNNPTGHNSNWGGPSRPQFTNCFPNYPDPNCAMFNCQKCVPPPMVNFCVPPQPIFPSFQIPLYPQPPSGNNIFVNCTSSFGYQDPMYCNNLTQSLPYSSPKEVDMETEVDLSEINNLGTKRPVDDSNRDPRLKPCVQTKPYVEVTLEESPTKIKPVAKKVKETIDFAKPLLYTCWRTPVLIEGIITPVYHNPRNNGLQFKNIVNEPVNNNCEDPRLDLIREIEPHVSTKLKEHCAPNGDPRLRFMTGPSGSKIKWKIGNFPTKDSTFGDLAPKTISTADAMKISSKDSNSPIINPNTEGEMSSAHKLLNPISPESPDHFGSKSTNHSSDEVTAPTTKPAKRHKKTATILPLKKIKLLEPEKQFEKLTAAHIADKMDISTNNLDNLVTPTKVNNSKKSYQKSMEKNQKVNLNKNCQTKVKKKKLRILEETHQNESKHSQSPKSSKAKSGSKSSSIEKSVDVSQHQSYVASKLDCNLVECFPRDNDTSSKVESMSKLRSNSEENIYESNDRLGSTLGLKVKSRSRSNSECISEEPLCGNKDDLDVTVNSRSRSYSDCVLDEAIRLNRVELEINVKSRPRSNLDCNFDEEQRNINKNILSKIQYESRSYSSCSLKDRNENRAKKAKCSSGDSDEFEFDESLKTSSVTGVKSSSKTSLEPCLVTSKSNTKNRHTVQREDEDNQAMPNYKSKICSKSRSHTSQNESDNVEHTTKVKPSSFSVENPVNDAVNKRAKLKSKIKVGSNSGSECVGEECDRNKGSNLNTCGISYKTQSGSKSRPTTNEDIPANTLTSHSKEKERLKTDYTLEKTDDETNHTNNENYQIQSNVKYRSKSNMEEKSSPKYVLVESDHDENDKPELSPVVKSRVKLEVNYASEENENQSDDTDIYNLAQSMSLENGLSIASCIQPSVKLNNGIESLDDGSKFNIAGHESEMYFEQNKLEKHIEKSSDLFEEVKSANLSMKCCSILNLVRLRERLVQVQNETQMLIKEAQVRGISTNDFGLKLLVVILTNCEAYLKEVEYVLFNSTPDTSRVKEYTQTPRVKVKKETTLDNIITLSSDSEVEQSPRNINIKVEEPSTSQHLFTDCIPVRIRPADLNSSPSTKFTLKFDQFCHTPIAVKQEPISTSFGDVNPWHGVAEANLFGIEKKLGIGEDNSNDSDDNSVTAIPAGNISSSWGQRKVKNRPKRGHNLV